MNWHEAALILVLVVVFIPLTVVLMRTRDRLAKQFGQQDGITLHASRHIGDGVKLCVVDVEGLRVLCAYGRNGEPTLHVLGPATPSPAKPAEAAVHESRSAPSLTPVALGGHS
jgi:flagellar biogenesis protein FliO